METNQQDPQPPQDLIADYHADIRQIEIEGYELGVKKARNALFWAGGLFFAGEMIAMYRSLQEFNWIVFVIALVEAGLFIALGLYTRKKPYTAIVLGLILFIGLILLGAVFSFIEGGTENILRAIFGGILVKILILLALIRPLKEAKELQTIKGEEKKI
ncbi:hypothetical protein [Ferruginibacter sp. HRS2-29]|uniref:hypothetical protein n=1 Tax=Ferruginibacter sp. HRS2-29 TaxID=2487334 RepID=UPI0020CD926A|nr:hypothetical protein [Ferruginibacter sp. HRS2-29]MCP9752202.1 hypothetical protein [Ferruginibacter sp. HRS2-29]